MRVPLTAIYETVEDGWTQARIEELPAVITAAPTRAEAKALLLDALQEFLLSLAEPPENGSAAEAARERLELVLES
jgi:predicted RNase H-like HicB family nuclease